MDWITTLGRKDGRKEEEEEEEGRGRSLEGREALAHSKTQMKSIRDCM